MGATSSVVRSKFDNLNGSLRFVYDSFLSTEDSDKINQLHEDLVVYEEVRSVFADYIWNRGMESMTIREIALAINEPYMRNLLLQDLCDDDRDYNSDIILYYISLFAASPVYEPYYKESMAMPLTPPLSRSPSMEAELSHSYQVFAH